jgi:hypothetical protein
VCVCHLQNMTRVVCNSWRMFWTITFNWNFDTFF